MLRLILTEEAAKLHIDGLSNRKHGLQNFDLSNPAQCCAASGVMLLLTRDQIFLMMAHLALNILPEEDTQTSHLGDSTLEKDSLPSLHEMG